jgi:hypothetical protein
MRNRLDTSIGVSMVIAQARADPAPGLLYTDVRSPASLKAPEPALPRASAMVRAVFHPTTAPGGTYPNTDRAAQV